MAILRSGALLAMAALVALAQPGAARAADAALDAGVSAVEAAIRFVPLGVGKSIVVDLPRDAKDVLVADPTIANAVVRSTRRAYIIGVKVGQTNVFFFDAEGRQIAGFDIAVKRDLNGLRVALRHAVPNGDVRAEALGAESVILTGSVATAAESQIAYDTAMRLLDGSTNIDTGLGKKVLNAITIRGRDQVTLKVTVAEVQRDVVKQLGINVNGTIGYGKTVLNFNTDNPFSASGGPISNTAAAIGFAEGTNSVQAKLQAMERAGVMRTLAEPNLTATSGESATFLVGGEFPIPAGSTCNPPGSGNCTVSIVFKKFGVGLSFTPIVLGEGRISLKVATEVSELSSEGALQQAGISIPSLRVRRAETAVEIPSGGALAMAGLLQEQTRQQINGVPGLMQVPVLGTLFKSRDYVNRQSELVVIVTPYIVRSVAPRELSRPDDGFADPSDPQAVLLGKLNRIYGGPTKSDPRRPYHGTYGFILD